MFLDNKSKKILMYIVISYLVVNSFVWIISIAILDQNNMLDNFEKYDLLFKISYIIPILIVISYIFYQKILIIFLQKRYKKYLIEKKYNEAYDVIRDIYIKNKDKNILLLYAISCCNINKFDEFKLLYKRQKGYNSILECYKLFVDYINEKSIEVNEIEPLISKINKYKNTNNIILLLKWINYSIINDKRKNMTMDIRILKEAKFINPLFINVSNKIIKELKNFDI